MRKTFVNRNKNIEFKFKVFVFRTFSKTEKKIGKIQKGRKNGF